MSFILDALRKSEHQRQKNTTPGIADNVVKPAQTKRSPWLTLAVILLLVNGVLVITLWWRSEPAEPEVAAQQASQQPRQAPDRMSNRQPASNPVAPQTQTNTSGSSPTEITVTPDAGLPQTSPVVQIPNATSSNLPSLETLQLQGVFTLPPMRVDIHVYSSVPAERFVFINMKKHREGSQLNEGPTVDSITPEGVIMTWKGHRFVMSKD
jgi:general secretion pathway protein B